MTPEQIKSRLKEKGLNQRKLARRLRRSATTVSFLIHGQLKSDKLEKRLANVLGVSVEELRGEGRAA